MKSIYRNFLIISFYLISVFNNLFAQNTPVWPVSSSIQNYNQVNCTFAEKHTQFHGGIDTTLFEV
jgi:hypothetical protein